MDRNNQRARDVYQRLLDEIGEAVIVEDKDRYTENFFVATLPSDFRQVFRYSDSIGTREPFFQNGGTSQEIRRY